MFVLSVWDPLGFHKQFSKEIFFYSELRGRLWKWIQRKFPEHGSGSAENMSCGIWHGNKNQVCSNGKMWHWSVKHWCTLNIVHTDGSSDGQSAWDSGSVFGSVFEASRETRVGTDAAEALRASRRSLSSDSQPQAKSSIRNPSRYPAIVPTEHEKVLRKRHTLPYRRVLTGYWPYRLLPLTIKPLTNILLEIE